MKAFTGCVSLKPKHRMDQYHHPMSSSCMMDLPLQLEQARKLLAKTQFFKSLQQKIGKYRTNTAIKVTALSMPKQGETVSID